MTALLFLTVPQWPLDNATVIRQAEILMEETRKRRWLIILFFTLVACLFIGFIYSAMTGSVDPRYRRRLEDSVNRFKEQQRRLQPDTVNIALRLNEEIQVGKNKIAFKGLKKNTLHLELFILDLDPEGGYPYALPVKEARRGIQLGEHRYVLKSASPSHIRLQRITK
jgi:hypothetical protein